jgi:hypothetical protein
MNPTFETSGYDASAFDRGAAPVLRIFSVEQAREVAKYEADASLRQRIDELAAKCNEGELTEAERAEYEGYVRANKFVAILQAQARKRLAAANPE